VSRADYLNIVFRSTQQENRAYAFDYAAFLCAKNRSQKRGFPEGLNNLSRFRDPGDTPGGSNSRHETQDKTPTTMECCQYKKDTQQYM